MMKKERNSLHALPFKTPEGYFGSFERRLMEKMPKEKIYKIVFTRKLYRWAAAAVILLLLGTIFLKIHFSEPTETTPVPTYSLNKLDLTNEEILEYLEISDDMDYDFILENL